MFRTAGWCALALTLLLPASVLGAAIPKHLSHQGILTDTNGVVVPDGLYTLTFGIHDAASDGHTLFSQTLQVQVVDGLYNVLLSDNPTSPGTLEEAFQNPTTYLQITIADTPPGSGITSGQTLDPRQKFASVPYAFVALSGTEQPLPLRELVDSHEASGDETVELQLPVEFERFEIVLIDVYPDTSEADLLIQASTDGGDNWYEAEGDYHWLHLIGALDDRTAMTFDSNEASTTSAAMVFNRQVGTRLTNDPGKGFNAEVTVMNPGGGYGYFTIHGRSAHVRRGNASGPDSAVIHGLSGALRATTDRVNAIRFKMGPSGKVAGGKFRVYGLR